MEICRLCFNSTSNSYTPLNLNDGSAHRKQLQIILPEIDLKAILSPVLCSNCSTTLEDVFILRKTWLECEKKLKNYLKNTHNLNNPCLFDVINEDHKLGILNAPINLNEEEEIKNELELDDFNLNEDIKIEENQICDICTKNECDCQYSCLICSKKFKTSLKLQRHSVTHNSNRPRPYSCDICQKCFYVKSSLINHQATHSESRKFSCDQCEGSQFACKKYLSDHIRRVHIKREEKLFIGEFRCDVCLKVFSTLLKMKRHKATLHKTRSRKHICEDCGQSFYTKSTLNNHKATHVISKEFSCEKCGLCFASKKYLMDHSRRLHETLKKVQSEVGVFECDMCNKKFTQKRYLTQHISNIHMGIKKKRPPKNLKCEYCGRIFTSDNLLTLHLRTHTGERPYKCDECEKSFAQASSLRTHKQAIHSNEKPYACEYCGKKFSTKGMLLKHIQSVHIADSIPKNHKCTFCGKAFRTQSQMLSHMKWHTNDRQFSCDLCEKSFVNNGGLRKHRKIHFDEKEHKCEFCGKGFHQKFNLKIHMKVHIRIEHYLYFNSEEFFQIEAPERGSVLTKNYTRKIRDVARLSV
ncbi:zinc finger protein ZFP2-like [Onthophagus taurus]|uniref:zinc finger protein ZFP2-like n=1 Tax=Onthophagus taurus TaxID=166361 RepID=UPI0039BE2A3E